MKRRIREYLRTGCLARGVYNIMVYGTNYSGLFMPELRRYFKDFEKNALKRLEGIV